MCHGYEIANMPGQNKDCILHSTSNKIWPTWPDKGQAGLDITPATKRGEELKRMFSSTLDFKSLHLSSNYSHARVSSNISTICNSICQTSLVSCWVKSSALTFLLYATVARVPYFVSRGGSLLNLSSSSQVRARPHNAFLVSSLLCLFLFILAF